MLDTVLLRTMQTKPGCAFYDEQDSDTLLYLLARKDNEFGRGTHI